MEKRGGVARAFVLALFLTGVLAGPSSAGEAAGPPAASGSGLPWWFWPLALFIVTFVIGIVAVLAGVGGGVLFVPIVGGFFPFHLDFVRATGLLMALSCALAAGPGLLRANLASLRLAMPAALVASISAILGAVLGFALPTHVIQICLGATILGICVLMGLAGRAERPEVRESDWLSEILRIHGVYREESTGDLVEWKVRRAPLGFLLFVGVGLLAGMFGIGAGWANVPVLNLLLGAPLKISVGTSIFMLSISGTSAAWVYINKGCVIPLIVVPSLVGIMLGSFIGVRLLKTTRPAFVRWIVVGVLGLAGLRALAKGFGV